MRPTEQQLADQRQRLYRHICGSSHLKPERGPSGTVRFCCPAPDHDDEHPSAWLGDRGWNCEGCGRRGGLRQLSELLGLPLVWGRENGGHVPPPPPPTKAKDRRPSPEAAPRARENQGRIVAEYSYVNERGELLFQVVRIEPGPKGKKKDFRQRRPEGKGGWSWKVEGVRKVLYRLPEVRAAAKAGGVVYVVEGEKDADRLAGLGFTATCNPGGAGKFTNKMAESLRGARTVVVEDNDPRGREHAGQVAAKLAAAGVEVRVLALPGLPEKGDVSDWLDQGGTPDQLDELAEKAPLFQQLTVNDFYAYMPTRQYLLVPTREMWPMASVNIRVPAVNGTKPAAWLDQNRFVDSMTWAPGEAEVLEGRHLAEGGWITKGGIRCFNLYRPPHRREGDPTQAQRWVEHTRYVFGDAAEHIIAWLAHRVQRPNEKINHALMLGGAPGVGKDTILEPVIHAIGPWNFKEISPAAVLGRFNDFVKSVILRVNEARDLGDVDRFKFYDHMKVYTAAPPNALPCEEKHLRPYMVPNVCGVIITTNHKTDGIYLPADDRRHFVAWSERTQAEFSAEYFDAMYAWFADGGSDHVAAYLAQLDLSGFNPKAPPPKTAAFFDIVNANRAPEDTELADVLELLQWPIVTTIGEIAEAAPAGDFKGWLNDRKSRRAIPHLMERAGYIRVGNPNDTRDGAWRIGAKRQNVYGRKDASERDRLAGANMLVEAARR